jgi:hypothetical protein
MLRVVCLVGGVSLLSCDWVHENVSQRELHVAYQNYSALYFSEGDALELEHP